MRSIGMSRFLVILAVAHGLSSPKPIRRVAVIGSGIAGLSVAQALTNQPHNNQGAGEISVEVFDKRRGLETTAGAGIQLNGGLASLGWMNAKVQEAVWKAGLPQRKVASRAKSWFQDGQADVLLELDLMQAVEETGGDAAEALLIDREGERTLLWSSIMRGALQQALYDTLPDKKIVQFQKNMESLLPNEDGGVLCCFSDGSQTGPYDLVVGCDGVQSLVKSKVDKRDTPPSIYSGLRIRYAVADGDPKEPIEQTATLKQYFGNGAYALHGIYGAGSGAPNTKCTFIVYLDDNYIGPFRRKQEKPKPKQAAVADENVDWSQDNRQELEGAKQQMLDQLRHCGIPTEGSELATTIANADRFFELGSYYHNPFGSWSRRLEDSSDTYLVLCGDAAHALPPFLGQGSNMAIQDAFCLSKQLFRYNAMVEQGETDVHLGTFLKEYEETRWPATFNVFWKAGFLGYLETGGFDGFYSKFRDVFFKTMGVIGVARKVLLGAAIPKV